jgi:hypothetical protein
MSLYGLAFGQDRHGGVVTMQPFCRQDMGLDQRMKRLQRSGAGANLIRQRRDAEIDALAGIALALAVERLGAGRTSRTSGLTLPFPSRV